MVFACQEDAVGAPYKGGSGSPLKWRIRNTWINYQRQAELKLQPLSASVNLLYLMDRPNYW